MKEECYFCKKTTKILPSNFALDELMKMPIKRVDDKISKLGLKNTKYPRFELRLCKICNTFWEFRPLYDESMYGGEPGEIIKVTKKYVEDHYIF